MEYGKEDLRVFNGLNVIFGMPSYEFSGIC